MFCFFSILLFFEFQLFIFLNLFCTFWIMLYDQEKTCRRVRKSALTKNKNPKEKHEQQPNNKRRLCVGFF